MSHLHLTSFRPQVIAASILAAIALMTCHSFPLKEASNIEKVTVLSIEQGQKLQIDGQDFMVIGMNWTYYPRGTNYAYSFWSQSDSFIQQALDYEMTLLQEMGVNSIRQYVGIPPRWIEHIHEQYGIYTILNHPFARYGYEYEGTWRSEVDYSSPELKAALLNDIAEMVQEYKQTRGLLMWMLGNENNYGLFWNSAETQNIPENNAAQMIQAKHLYKLVNEAVKVIHLKDRMRPVALANGDLQFIELIASEVKDLDIFGANVYRGESFGDIFQVVHEELGIPILFTEFGADAFDAVKNQEDPQMQVKYLLANWEEIYNQSFGMGNTGNAIGGCTFQFSDGWWKTDLDANLEVHDTRASWSNGGYSEDFIPGRNNMNEEWFGICAKGPTDSLGHYQLYPRIAYSALKQAHTLDLSSGDLTASAISDHFSLIRQSGIQNYTEPDSSVNKSANQNSAKL